MAKPQGFTYDFTVPLRPGQLNHELVGPLATVRYKPVAQSEYGAEFERNFHPGFQIFFMVIFFPIGLLLLLAPSKHRLSLQYQAGPGGTGVRVTGTEAPAQEFFEKFPQRYGQAVAPQVGEAQASPP